MRSQHDAESATHARASAHGTETGATPAVQAHSPEPGTDILSDVLQSIRLTGSLFFLVDATSPWGSTAPAGTDLAAVLLPKSQQLISYHLVSSGGCWCEIEGEPPARLEAGDVAVIAHGHAYSLATTPGLRDEVPVKWYEDAVARKLPFVVPEGGGGPDRVQIICGFLGCDVLPFNPLLGTLPPLLHVRGGGDRPASRLRQFIEFAATESAEPTPGGHCVLLRIGELIFVEVVRRHLASLPAHERGWLAALRDPAIGRVLALLHRQPQAPWTLELLAKQTGMSRTILAERFAELCGQPPMQYLSQWRMQLATRKLADGKAKVATIALEVGYESESAFSRAFKKTVGESPVGWRKRHGGAA